MSANPSPTTPLAIDVREAARLLSVCAETVARMARRGEIPHFHVGRSLRFSVDALRQYVAEQSAAQMTGTEWHPSHTSTHGS